MNKPRIVFIPVIVLAVLFLVAFHGCSQSERPTNAASAEVSSLPADAQTVSITAGKDTTIFANSDNSGGAASTIFSGTNNRGGSRRALIWFDVAGSVSAGSTITNAELTLHLVGAAPTETMQRDFTLHSLIADWGEGQSGKGETGRGRGAEPTRMDATWNFRLYKSEAWVTPGGDFNSTANASTSIGTDAGLYTWVSTQTLVKDVQNWLDQPTTNFGWAVVGPTSINGTARRFGSREATASVKPSLRLEFVLGD